MLALKAEMRLQECVVYSLVVAGASHFQLESLERWNGTRSRSRGVAPGGAEAHTVKALPVRDDPNASPNWTDNDRTGKSSRARSQKDELIFITRVSGGFLGWGGRYPGARDWDTEAAGDQCAGLSSARVTGAAISTI